MKTSLLKALPLTAALLMPSAFATEPAEQQDAVKQTFEKHVEMVLSASEDGPEKTMKIVVRGSDDGETKTWITDVDSDSDEVSPSSEADSTLIRFQSSEDGIASIKKVIKTLAMTEWQDLSKEDKEELLETLENLDDDMELEVRHDIELNSDSDAQSIIAIIAVFGLPLFLLIAVLYYKHRKRMVKVALVKDYLDAGKDVPADVLVAINGGEPDAPADSFQSAVRNIAIGAGLFLFLGLMIDWDLAAVALIPLFIGIGKLIVWRMNRDATDNQAD
jgi:succinate dehydrogenase flavin-adding protein (antitoxin of CptAB toxin-antitoxin module)